MARKLTKAELERYAADFDPPMPPQQPTKKATTKKATKKAEEKKTEKRTPDPDPKRAAAGRPGAFERVQIVTLKLPPEDVIKLKVKAAEQGKTMAQVIHDWLN